MVRIESGLNLTKLHLKEECKGFMAKQVMFRCVLRVLHISRLSINQISRKEAEKVSRNAPYYTIDDILTIVGVIMDLDRTQYADERQVLVSKQIGIELLE